MLDTLEGVDHVIITTENLDRAAENWHSLGFTLSPKGFHSAHLGSANHTVMFDNDYIELLGFVNPTEHNQADRDFLAQYGDGLERIAFTTTNAEQGVATLQAKGIPVQGPIEFSRPVSLPDGSESTAAFSIFLWNQTDSPAATRIFACQHYTRDVVWAPKLLDHPNTASGILRLDIIASNPLEAATHMASLIGSDVNNIDYGVEVATGSGRATLLFMEKEVFARMHGIENLEFRPQGVAAIIIGVRDLGTAARYAGPHAIVENGRASIPAEFVNGVRIVFESV